MSATVGPLMVAMVLVLSGCATVAPAVPDTPEDAAAELAYARQTAVFGPAKDFHGSQLEDVGRSELYPVRSPDECEVAVLDSGEGSFAARLAMLKGARKSIRRGSGYWG